MPFENSPLVLKALVSFLRFRVLLTETLHGTYEWYGSHRYIHFRAHPAIKHTLS